MPTRRRRQEFERIRVALAEADEALTARELRDRLEERGMAFESAHQVATVLGRLADRGVVEVIQSSPYRYRVSGEE